MIESFRTAIDLIGLVRVPGIENLTPYLLYCGLFLIFIITSIILIKKLTKKREHVSHKYMTFEINDNSDINYLLNDIYENEIKKFNNKEYFVIESLILNNKKYRIIRLHKDIYDKLDKASQGMLKESQIHGEYNKELVDLLHKKAKYFEIETKTDYVIPYIPYNASNKKVDGVNLIQICLRPIKKTWLRDLNSLQRGLLKGYDETLRWNGCIGGFVGVFYPLVMIRENLNSNKSNVNQRNLDIKIPSSKFINKKFENKYNLIEKKKSNVAFDVTIKLIIDNDDSLKILNDLFNILNNNIEEDSNSYVLKEKARFSASLKDKVQRAYHSENSIDIMNNIEITEVIKRIIL